MAIACGRLRNRKPSTHSRKPNSKNRQPGARQLGRYHGIGQRVGGGLHGEGRRDLEGRAYLSWFQDYLNSEVLVLAWTKRASFCVRARLEQDSLQEFSVAFLCTTSRARTHLTQGKGKVAPVNIYYFILSLLSVLPAGGESETPRAALPSYSAQAPSSAVVPEAIPTEYARLLARPGPTSRDWMLSVEGATRAPVDVGAQVTLESPFHVRFSAGYGWVPTAYSSLFTGLAGAASGNATEAAVLNHASYQGRTFRTAIGVRPFATRGLHVDVGYARLNLDGTLDLASSGLAGPGGQGAFVAHTTADAWLVEVGSQVEEWGMVFGFAFGLMRTYASQTTINAANGAAIAPSLVLAAQQIDAALSSYGYVPTVTLRLGFDLLSIRSWASHRG
jgi:hypothetical protein